MSKFLNFYQELARMIKGWSDTTTSIVIGVLVAVAFYFFAKFLKANKSDVKRIGSISSLFIFTLCLGAIILIVACLNY